MLARLKVLELDLLNHWDGFLMFHLVTETIGLFLTDAS